MREDLGDFDEIVLPAIELPWESSLHPDVQELHIRRGDWCDRFELFRDDAERDRWAGYRVAWLAGRCFPHADREFAQWTVDFVQWYYLFDDTTADRVETAEQATSMVARLAAALDVLDLDRLGQAPMHGEAAWLDVCRRLRELLPSNEHYQRWANTMRMWLLSLAMQVFDQINTGRSDPRSYMSYRRYSAGLKMPFAVVDVANAGAITPEEYHDPNSRLLDLYAHNVVAWANDVLSAPTEVREPATRSLVTVLKDADPHRSWQEALDLAAARTNAEIAAFADLADVVRRTASPHLCGWIDGLQDWMVGTVTWSLVDSARFGHTAATPLVGATSATP